MFQNKSWRGGAIFAVYGWKSDLSDEEIDQRVYILYGLSPDEIRIVEGKE